MDQDINEFDRRLLHAVREEPVPYEWLIEKLSSGTEDLSSCHATEMTRHNLLSAISRGLIGACLVHAEVPFITPVNATLETLPRYWFYCTHEGRKALWGIKKT
jgi:hypothetical protein